LDPTLPPDSLDFRTYMQIYGAVPDDDCQKLLNFDEMFKQNKQKPALIGITNFDATSASATARVENAVDVVWSSVMLVVIEVYNGDILFSCLQRSVLMITV